MGSTRDSFLDRKISMLEKRLSLLEKFVELRFHDFSRDGGDEGIKDDVSAVDSKSKSRKQEADKSFTPKTRLGIGRLKGRKTRVSSILNRPAPASVKRQAEAKAILESMKTCVVRVTRNSERAEEDKSARRTRASSLTAGGGVNRELIMNDCQRPRYNIRSSRRGGGNHEDSSKDREEMKEEVQVEEIDVHAEVQNPLEKNEASEDFTVEEQPTDVHDEIEVITSPNPDTEKNDEDEDKSYFSFSLTDAKPKKGVRKKKESKSDSNDEDWSAPENADTGNQNSSGEETDDEKAVSKESRKRGRKSVVTTSGPKKYPRKYISASTVTLTSDCLARADPGRRECPMCHQHVKEEYYEIHVQTHTKERHLKCKHCDKWYFSEGTLRKHMRMHSPDKYGRNCRLCEKMFFQTGKLLAHERFCVRKALEQGKNVDQEIIDELKKRSSFEWALEISAILTAATSGPEKQKCPHCAKEFKVTVFQKHVRSHLNTRDWACNFCNKAYYFKNDLKRHIATDHVQVSCDKCSTMFNDKAQLKLHRKTCKKPKPKKHKGVQEQGDLIIQQKLIEEPSSNPSGIIDETNAIKIVDLSPLKVETLNSDEGKNDSMENMDIVTFDDAPIETISLVLVDESVEESLDE